MITELAALAADIESVADQIEMPYTMQKLGDLFDRMDQDKTGHIHPNAIVEGLVSESWNKEVARQVSDMIHVNHDGLVSKHTFIGYMSEKPGTFTKERDDKIVIWHFFREVDQDGNGTISLKELQTALKKFEGEGHAELAAALSEEVQILKTLKKSDGEILSKSGNGNELSFKDFSRVVGALPRIRGERLLWVQSLGIDGELARLLEPGTVFDGLSGILQMSQEQLRSVCDKFSRQLPILLKEGVEKLRTRVESPGVISEAQEANSKFCGTAGAFHGRFATLEEFYQGPEGLIGQPNPKLLEGMNREHCKRDSSKRFFVTPNYLLHTTAEWEWFWVQNPPSESLPTDLQKRLNDNNTMYPGEVGDVLMECEVQLSLLKASFDDAALKSWREDLKTLLENSAQAASSFDLSVVDDETASAMENGVTIQIQVSSNSRISHAVQRKRLFGAVAKLGMKPDASTAIETSHVSGSDSDWKFHMKISKTEISKFLQEKLASALGNLFDEKQHLRGARIISRQPADNDKERIVLFIAIPSSDLKSKLKIHDKLAALKLGEIDLAITVTAIEHYYCDCRSVNDAKKQQKQGRTRQGTFHDFFQSDLIRNTQAILVEKGLAELIREEMMGLCLYTGPLYFLYNAVLRGFPISITDLLREENGEINRFETTIFVICSGISKLSRLTDVPPNRLLYRGLGGMLLPDQFWKDMGEGYKGGVEYGLLSTTTNKDVAIEYSGIKHKRGILLEIQAGRIDIGASISFLSQYPGEEEFLMPPLSCMEVTSEPRLEKTAHGEMLVFPLRVNVNLKSLTVEDLTQRRKNLHLSMTKNLWEDISITASALIEELQIFEQRRIQGLYLEPIFGDVSQVRIASEEDSIKFSAGSFCTVGAPSLWVSSGQVYYEVEVKDPARHFYVGWAGTSFQGRCIGFDKKSWSVYQNGSFVHRNQWSHNRFGTSVVVGTVLGVALDIASGEMRVTFDGKEEGIFGGTCDFPIKPHTSVGGALFPVISGCGNCELVLKTGIDGFYHAFPSNDYLSLAAACRDRFLKELTKKTLVSKFEQMMNTHKAKDSHEFNDDHDYKHLLNQFNEPQCMEHNCLGLGRQALDLKGCLLAQLETVILLRKEGASVKQLNVCVAADTTDFRGKRLQDECPKFLWRSIFCGRSLNLEKRVSIPLSLPASQVSLIWEAVMASEAVSEVKLGGQGCDEMMELSFLVPNLQLNTSSKYFLPLVL